MRKYSCIGVCVPSHESGEVLYSPRSSSRFSLFCLLAYCFIMMNACMLSYTYAQSVNLLDEPRGLYLGVQPGQNKYAPGKTVRKSTQSHHITWVGFKAVKDRAKVFIQGNRSLLYEIASSDAKQIIIDFPNAKLQTRNDARNLDTRYFPTVVLSIKAQQVLSSLVRVTIQLRQKVKYQIKKDQKFLYLVFDPPRYPIDLAAEIAKYRRKAENNQEVIEYKNPIK